MQACAMLQVVVCCASKLTLEGAEMSCCQPKQMDTGIAQSLLELRAPGQVSHLLSGPSRCQLTRLGLADP